MLFLFNLDQIKFSNAPSEDNWFTPWREMFFSSPGDVSLFCFSGLFFEPMCFAVYCLHSFFQPMKYDVLLSLSLCGISYFVINLLAFDRAKQIFYLYSLELFAWF